MDHAVFGSVFLVFCAVAMFGAAERHWRWRGPARLGFSLPSDDWWCKVTRTELIIQLLKLAIGLAFGAYFVWWSLEVPDRLTLEDQARASLTVARPQAH
jgi:hypothetical protein